MSSALPILKPWRAALLPTIGAVLFAWAALTPSLLPRGAVMQGALCAVSALIGYGVGAFAHWIAKAAGLRAASDASRRTWRMTAAVTGIASLAMLLLSHGWQQAQRADIGMPRSSAWELLTLVLVAAVLFALLLVISRAIRGAGRSAIRQIDRVLPRAVAVVLGTLLVAWGTVWLVQGVAVGRVGSALDASFLVVNDEFVDTDPPAVAELSAGPGSLVSWESLGRQGRVFIANAPSRQQIEGFWADAADSGASVASDPSDASATSDASNPDSVLQPVRVYVGGEDGRFDLDAQAEIAIDELQRTGAFDRAVLNVVTGTGRGWVNENQARALELMWKGDTAAVSMQYSYLPSWMSYLVDSQRAREAGRVLFEHVYAHWSTLDEASRPLLVVSGESLGSFGSEGAFSGAQGLAARTDGALYVGPTANNVLWAQFTAERESDTPVFLPVYDSGDTVRFSPDGRDWAGSGPWEQPRVGYLQHANDPVTWLDFGIALAPPEWLRGERGPGVPDAMIWVPVVTALQLAVDQLAGGIPDGQGHEFGQAPAYAWASVLPPPGWNDTMSERLAERLAQLRVLDLDSTSSS